MDKATQMIVGGYLGLSCSATLSAIYSGLGQRFMLLSAFVISHTMTYVFKLYIITRFVYFPEEYHPHPTLDVFLVPFNSFAIIFHNAVMLFNYIHTWKTVTVGPDVYNFCWWQGFYVKVAALLGISQVIINFVINPDLEQQHVLPFQYLNAAILILTAIIGPFCTVVIIYELFKARGKTLVLSKRSAISMSLLYRLVIALIAGTVITCKSVWAILTLNVRGSAGQFSSYDLYSSDLDRLHARYCHSLLTGIFIFFVLGTSKESRELGKRAGDLLNIFCGRKRPICAALPIFPKQIGPDDLENPPQSALEARKYYRPSNVSAYVTEEGALALDGSVTSTLRPTSTMASTYAAVDGPIAYAEHKRRSSLADHVATLEAAASRGRYERRALSSPFAMVHEDGRYSCREGL